MSMGPLIKPRSGSPHWAPMDPLLLTRKGRKKKVRGPNFQRPKKLRKK